MEREIGLKKVAITGSTGTIGVALTNYLTSQGVHCYLLNAPEFVHEEDYVDKERLTFIDCPIGRYKEFTKAGSCPRDCDAFIHLSWIGTFGPNRDNADLQSINIQGVLEAIELAKEMGCSSFLGAGSQAEYGRGVEREDRCPDPFTGYGIAKFAAGKLGALKAKQLGLRFNWVRIFSVYGPRGMAGSLTQYVVSSLLNGVSPELTPCEQLWDFLYTEDAARALAAVAERGKDGKTYELGSGVSGTIRSFLEPVPELLGIDVPIHFGAVPYPQGQVMKLCARVQELKDDTGWEPHFSFADGIKAIAESLKD